nr:LD23983p [Drosophila melanogaster]
MVWSLQGNGEHRQIAGQKILQQGGGAQDRCGQIRGADGALQGAQHANVCLFAPKSTLGLLCRRRRAQADQHDGQAGEGVSSNPAQQLAISSASFFFYLFNSSFKHVRLICVRLCIRCYVYAHVMFSL